MGILDAVRSLRRARAEEQVGTFRELVLSVARQKGGKLDAKAIDRQLAASGRSIEEFEAAVERAVELEELRAVVANKDRAAAEARAASDRLRKLVDEKTEAVRKLDEKIEAATLESRRLSSAREQIAKAEERAAAVLDELQRVFFGDEPVDASQGIAVRLEEARINLAAAERRLRSGEQYPARGEDIPALRAEVASLRTEIEQLESEAPAAAQLVEV